MTSRTRISPLLAPYLTTSQPASLILLTSVLGASTNWLVLQFLLVALSPGLSGLDIRDEVVFKDGNVNVILVSFLRDWEFWRDGGRRLGLDLTRLVQKGRLTFVDGLSSLFAESGADPRVDRDGMQGQGQEMVLKDPKLEVVEQRLSMAIQSVTGIGAGNDRLLLVLDGIDLLLAATDTDAQSVTDMLAELRMHVHSTVITVSADHPLTQSPCTPLETNHAAFLTSLGHQAVYVMGLRLLDTGTARDISGILRITRGPEGDDVEEKEVLYYVGGDGGVRVFERGT